MELMKSINRKLLILIGCVALVAACSSTPTDTGYTYKPAQVRVEERARLHQHYRAWAGTPHQMGGLSRRGIDCSGFVYVTYRDVYGMRLPRSTDQLWDIGEEVALRDVQTGDLLMFKTGFKQRHVGIYVGDGEFIHASSSSGVMSSNVHSPYWSDAYRGARRVAQP
ncbi:MAG: hypothetical protein CMK89_05890 [Pseudomonadales bacterium]|nr:hypothetical protein [Pseudomonadales bacterium]